MVEVGEVHKPSLNDLLERLTLGVSRSLEKRPGVCDVSLTGGEPAERHQIVGWEQRNGCTLPDDLKNFYLTTDGVLLTWSAYVEGIKCPVGRMEINPFNKLVKLCCSSSTTAPGNIPSIADIDVETSSDDESDDDDSNDHKEVSHRKRPHFDSRSRIFELESCQGYGKVCLVYKDTSPGLPAQKHEIWFLDRSLQWHFLSHDFTSYYRLMLMHLGLPQWHFALTKLGIGTQAKQWFNLYAPIRLRLDEDDSGETSEIGVMKKEDSTNTKIDFAKLFRGRVVDKGKPKQSHAPPSQLKKKGNFQSVTSSTSIKSNSSRGGRMGKPWT